MKLPRHLKPVLYWSNESQKYFIRLREMSITEFNKHYERRTRALKHAVVLASKLNGE